jgi:hypothetical protein
LLLLGAFVGKREAAEQCGRKVGVRTCAFAVRRPGLSATECIQEGFAANQHAAARLDVRAVSLDPAPCAVLTDPQQERHVRDSQDFWENCSPDGVGVRLSRKGLHTLPASQRRPKNGTI